METVQLTIIVALVSFISFNRDFIKDHGFVIYTILSCIACLEDCVDVSQGEVGYSKVLQYFEVTL